MAEYFTSDHFKLLNKWQGQKRDESNPEQNRAYDELKKAFEVTERWAHEVQQRLFPAGHVKIRKRPTSQANVFFPYNWARIYPSKPSPNILAYTVGINPNDGFVVKIDTVQADPELRTLYEKVRGPMGDSPIVALLPASEGLGKSLNELVEWSIEAINKFKISYLDLALMLGLMTGDDPDVVLDHFRGHRDFIERQPSWGNDITELFCRLATAVHEAEFDWWFTKATNSQLRFGHKDKGAAKGDPVGWAFLMRDGLKISWKPFTDREGSDMVPLTAELVDDLEKYFFSLGNKKKELFRGSPTRQPYWPDDYIGEVSLDEGHEVALGRKAFNRIYYGPPGTGKTYQLLKLLDKDYTDDLANEDPESWLVEQVRGLNWFQVIALVLLETGKSVIGGGHSCTLILSGKGEGKRSNRKSNPKCLGVPATAYLEQINHCRFSSGKTGRDSRI